MVERPEKDAEATALLCFTSPPGSGPPTVRICLGVSPPPRGDGPALDAKTTLKFAFTVEFAGVKVALPNPLTGAAPVQGIVNIAESLTLSLADMKALQAWLALVLSRDEKEHKIHRDHA